LIEPEYLIIQGSPIHDRPEDSSPSAVDRAFVGTIAARLAEFRSVSVPGAYDSVHLQQIHARIFQDLFPWAGQFRAPESSSSLDALFDRLARENRLKGLDPDVWSKRSTEYFTEIVAIEPFIEGTDFASLEFFRELASENNLTLHRRNGRSELSHDELQSHLQEAQSNSIRRILMLAVDPYPSIKRAMGSREDHKTRDRITALDLVS
jgi:fido (protein-threonine AMPylation protein)